MRNPPPEVVASWPEPNYIDPEYRGPQLAISGIILLVISYIVVGLRLWVRVRMKRSVGWDDWLLVAAMPLVVGITTSTIIGTHYGWGMHIWDNKPEWMIPSRLTSWISQFLWVIMMTLIKLSILAQYLRLSTTTTFTRTVWAMIYLVAAWGLACTVTVLCSCRPLSHYWTGLTDEACLNDSEKFLGVTISEIITNFIILLLPIPILWKLQLPIREKTVLVVLMNLGILACVAAVVKMYYMYKTLDVTYDVSWYGYQSWMWNAIEVNLAVICPSIPTLRPFMRKYFPRLAFRHTSHNPTLGGDDAAILEPRVYKPMAVHHERRASSSTGILQADGYPMSYFK